MGKIPYNTIIVNKYLKVTHCVPNANDTMCCEPKSGDLRVDELPLLEYTERHRQNIAQVLKTCRERNTRINISFPIKKKGGEQLFLRAKLVPMENDLVSISLEEESEWSEMMRMEQEQELQLIKEMAEKYTPATSFAFNYRRFKSCDQVNCNGCFQFHGAPNELLNKNRHVCRALSAIRHPDDHQDFFFLFSNLRNLNLKEESVTLRLRNDAGEYVSYNVTGKVETYDQEGKANLIVGLITEATNDSK
ncbi:hypothetical protein LJC38_05165 [Parabacteroides sp. OttesenSCG-928-K15]|nr:hypothetical protein [Parabacteroides sp. OttesenSCG-928-K15]